MSENLGCTDQEELLKTVKKRAIEEWGLTDRQAEVAAMLAAEDSPPSYKKIAKVLSISPRTVGGHLQVMRDKVRMLGHPEADTHSLAFLAKGLNQ